MRKGFVKPRKRKCKICGDSYLPLNTLQKTCLTPLYALEHHRASEKKKRRKELRQAKQKLKSRSQWLKEAQTVFNRYIRNRDRGKPCISCGERLGETPNTWDCGHYRSVGAAPELRFEEANAHRQCKSCNGGHFRKTNFVVTEERKETIRAMYRVNLIRRIGLPKVEWVEGPHPPAKWTIEEIKEIKDTISKKTYKITLY